MKKSLKKRFKSWKIGDYVRQFSIVTGGVLLTLWLTTRIADSSKQKEVRQAAQLVTHELEDNLRIIRQYEERYNEERRVSLRLQEERFSTAALPADTILYYSLTVASEVMKPFEFSTDALEMFKTSGILPHVANKELVTELLRCYKSLESLDKTLGAYYDERRVIFTTQMDMDFRAGADFRTVFDKTIADKKVQGWLYMLPRAFNRGLFTHYGQEVEEMIAELKKTYK